MDCIFFFEENLFRSYLDFLENLFRMLDCFENHCSKNLDFSKTFCSTNEEFFIKKLFSRTCLPKIVYFAENVFQEPVEQQNLIFVWRNFFSRTKKKKQIHVCWTKGHFRNYLKKKNMFVEPKVLENISQKNNKRFWS